MIAVAGIDHIVLTVRSIEATVEFYERVLNMEARTFLNGRMALHFGTSKINLHQAGAEFEPKALRAVPGSADLCFHSEATVDELAEQMKRSGVEVISGPIGRTGARGAITSFYFRDPDGNLIEISTYR